MPNNTDIHDGLTEQMVFDRAINDGRRLFRCPVFSEGEGAGKYLYRSMTIDEARNWFDPDFMPGDSGIPWSTNPVYSLNNYLKGDSEVQLEVPAHDILERIRAVGATPKYEGDGQTWGTGPTAEIGRKPSRLANNALVDLYGELNADAPLSKRDILKSHKSIQNALFRKMFKDKIPRARVVARLFPAA